MSRITTFSVLLLFYFTARVESEGQAILHQPESMTVTVGQDATFSCAGQALAIVWTINDVNIDDLNINDIHVYDMMNGVRTSNITVDNVTKHDNASVRCILMVLTDAPTIPSSIAILKVLGIGPMEVLHVNTTVDSTTCIQWEEPMFMSSDVTEVLYNVSVDGIGVLSFTNTTSDTQYCLEFTSCQEYTITITPFSTSPDYSGTSSTVTYTPPGDNYRFEEPCLLDSIEFMVPDNVHVAAFFKCQVGRLEAPCPFQRLHVSTSAYYSGLTGMFPLNSSLPINDTKTSIVMEVDVAGLPAREQYYSNFSIINPNGAIVNTGPTISFSTYSVQNATFSHLTSTNNVEVTCFFAKNAPASACIALFENSSFGLRFNSTVFRASGSLYSSEIVGIPQEVLRPRLTQELTSAVFDVSVYDVDVEEKMADKPALVQRQVLEVEFDVIELDPTASTHFTGTTVSTLIPSISSTVKQNGKFELWKLVAILVSTSVFLVLAMVLVMVPVAICCYKKKRKPSNGGTDGADAPSKCECNVLLCCQMSSPEERKKNNYEKCFTSCWYCIAGKFADKEEIREIENKCDTSISKVEEFIHRYRGKKEQMRS